MTPMTPHDPLWPHMTPYDPVWHSPTIPGMVTLHPKDSYPPSIGGAPIIPMIVKNRVGGRGSTSIWIMSLNIMFFFLTSPLRHYLFPFFFYDGSPKGVDWQQYFVAIFTIFSKLRLPFLGPLVTIWDFAGGAGCELVAFISDLLYRKQYWHER